VDVVIAPTEPARGDPRLLRIALANLLDNAWKYTGKSAAARIEFGCCREGDACVYYVKDNGVGFDPAYAGKLFGAFQRLHSEAEYPGTGIGLATLQRIVHRHGGRVWAEGEPNRGARFCFTLGNVAGSQCSAP
jgi:light-regulated signal transduction histidine kinase (bacteriophytochrome)